MSIQFSEEDGGKLLYVHASGKLGEKDYARFMPEIERLIRRHVELRMLVDITGFQGWDAGGLWEELKGAVKYFSAMQQCAVIGDKRWEQTVTEMGKPFTRGELRYFDHSGMAEARKWLKEGYAGKPETGEGAKA